MIHHVGVVAREPQPAGLWVVLSTAGQPELVGSTRIERWECECFAYRVGGETLVEVVVPWGGALQAWLDERGVPSLHHVAVGVADVRAAAAAVVAAGGRLVSPEPVVGVNGWLVNFVHPSYAGILLELVEEVIEVRRASLADQDAVERASQSDAAVKEFKYLWRRYGNWADASALPFVAMRGAEVVGFHAATFGAEHVNSYYQWVSPRVRGRGIGGRMVAAVLAEARRVGCARLKFKVPHDSDGQRFWEGFGLRPFGTDAKHRLYDVSLQGVETPSDLARAASVLTKGQADRYRRKGVTVTGGVDGELF